MCLFQCRAHISVDFVDMGSISVIGLTFLSVFGQRVYYCMIDLGLLSLTFESLQCHGCCCLECVNKHVFFISYGLSYLTSLTPTIKTPKSTLFIYSNIFYSKLILFRTFTSVTNDFYISRTTICPRRQPNATLRTLACKPYYKHESELSFTS